MGCSVKAVEWIIRWFFSMVGNAVMALVGGWMLMLAVGVAHAHWWPGIPTIGYAWAALIVWLLQGSFTTVDMSKKSDD